MTERMAVAKERPSILSSERCVFFRIFLLGLDLTGMSGHISDLDVGR
jgi:hypothetical protein